MLPTRSTSRHQHTKGQQPVHGPRISLDARQHTEVGPIVASRQRRQVNEAARSRAAARLSADGG